MATETLFPDGLVSSANYVSPALSDFDDDPDTTTDYGDWDGNGNTDVLLDLPTPTGNPTIGADLQTIRVAVRKADATGGNTPDWSLEIWEGAVQVAVIATGSLADNTSKQIISGTFNASILGTADGSALQVKVLQTAGATGTPGARRAVEVGGVEWQVDYVAGAFELDVDVGSYVISGKTVDFGIGLPVATGSYVITGKDAGVYGHRLLFQFDRSDEGNSPTFWNSSGSGAFSQFSHTGTTITDPDVEELSGGGTTAARFDDPGGTIDQVRFRTRCQVSAYDDLDIEVFTNAKAESLGSQNTGARSMGFLPYTVLSTPAGGWDWIKLEALEVYINETYTSGDGACTVTVIELEVYYTPNTVEVNTYYYDGSGVAAEGADWNNPTNADDGNDTTFADELDPDTGNLTVDGTSAPSGNTANITKIRARFKGFNNNYTSIETDFDDRLHVGDPFITQTESGLDPAAYSNWEEMFRDGGWYWEKLSDLEISVRGIGPSASGEVRTYISELEVTSFSSGAFTLQVDVGSYVISGKTVDFEVDLPVEVGSYVLTGIAADLDQGFGLDIDVGSYVLTGIAADLDLTRVLAVDVGSYVLTGLAAGLTAQRYIGAGEDVIASYYLDASDAGPTDLAVAWTNDANAFNGSTSNFAFVVTDLDELEGTGTTAPTSGEEITALKWRIFASSSLGTGIIARLYHNDLTLSASIIVTSSSAGWSGYTVTVPPEDEGWTWQKANDLETRFEALPGVGEDRMYKIEFEVTSNANRYAIKGKAVALIEGFNLQAATGSYVISGQSVALQAAQILLSDVGSYVITGLAAGLNKTFYLAAGGEHFVDSFHFDNVPVDAEAVWNNLANASDGSTSTFADTTVERVADANKLLFQGNAADIPAGSANWGIEGVRARAFVQVTGSGTPRIVHRYLNSIDSSIYASASDNVQTADWTSYLTLLSAHQIWSWSELQEVEALVGGKDDPGTMTEARIYRVELEVSYHKNHYLISGKSAGLTHVATLDIDVGSYVLTGISADLDLARVLVVDVGSYVLTGISVDLQVGNTLIADVGSYVLTGIAADLQAGKILISDVGSYVLTGIAADLDQGFGLDVDVGSYVITGIGADLQVANLLEIAVGSYVITGIAADLQFAAENILTVGVGSYTLTGFSTALHLTFQIDCVAGVYVLTGLGADLDQGHVLAGAVGSYTITGIEADLQQGHVIHNVAGVYNISGISAALDTEPKLSADTGSYVIAGVAAALNPSKVRRIYLVG